MQFQSPSPGHPLRTCRNSAQSHTFTSSPSGCLTFPGVWESLLCIAQRSRGHSRASGCPAPTATHSFIPISSWAVWACMLNCFSRVWLCVTLWTVTHQAPLSMGFSRQEYWSGLPCTPLRNLPDVGIKPASPVTPALQAGSLPLSRLGNPPKLASSKLSGHSCSCEQQGLFTWHNPYTAAKLGIFSPKYQEEGIQGRSHHQCRLRTHWHQADDYFNIN